MPVELTHENVRDITKNVRAIAGRDVKYTAILEAIAAALGKRGDALMHELKNEKTLLPSRRTKATAPVHVVAAKGIGTSAGFWAAATGDGESWLNARLLEARIHGWAGIDVYVYSLQDGRRTLSPSPADPVWMVDLVYRTVARVDDLEHVEGLTLQEAIAHAYRLADQRHDRWRRVTTAYVDYDLDETQPMLFAKVTNKAIRPDEKSSRAHRYAVGHGTAFDGKNRAVGPKVLRFRSNHGKIDTIFGPATFCTRVVDDTPNAVGLQAKLWRAELNVFYDGVAGGLTHVDVEGTSLQKAMSHASNLREHAASVIEGLIRSHRGV